MTNKKRLLFRTMEFLAKPLTLCSFSVKVLIMPNVKCSTCSKMYGLRNVKRVLKVDIIR